MGKLIDLLNDKNGFQVKLRCENYFDSEEFELIKNTIIECGEEWKKWGYVPIEDMGALLDLVSQLAGGSRFCDEETAAKSVDAELEIHEIIIDLVYQYQKQKFSIINEINKLSEKYGDEFNWGTVPENNTFVRELLDETNISDYCSIEAIAHSYSNDDVLFLFNNMVYRIYHLTYSKHNIEGFPKYVEFTDGKAVIGYLEKQFNDSITEGC